MPLTSMGHIWWFDSPVLPLYGWKTPTWLIKEKQARLLCQKTLVFCHCICLLASDEAKEILGYDICISCSSLFWKYVWHSVDREYHLSFWPVLPNPQIDWYPHQKSLSLLLFSSLFSEQTSYWNQQKEVCSLLSFKKREKNKWPFPYVN